MSLKIEIKKDFEGAWYAEVYDNSPNPHMNRVGKTAREAFENLLDTIGEM